MKLEQQYFEVVNCIRQYADLQKQDLAKILDISMPTLKAILDSKKAINRQGEKADIIKASNSQKDPLALNGETAFFLGISIGTGQIKLSVIDINFDCLRVQDLRDIFQKNSINIEYLDNNFLDEIDEKDRGDLYGYCFNTCNTTEEVIKLINGTLSVFVELINKGFPIMSIGFSFPGGVDNVNNIAYSNNNLVFENQMTLDRLVDRAICDELRKYDISIWFDHDIKASITSEKFAMYRIDSPLYNVRDKQNLCCLYLGTGVGAGLIIDNHLYRGSNNFCGEVGHIQIPDFYSFNQSQANSVEECQCGKKNCFELLLRRNVFGLSRDEFRSASPEELENKMHNAETQDLFVSYISFIINMVVNIFDLDVVILTGRLAEIACDSNIWRSLDEKKYKNALSYFPPYTIGSSQYKRFAPAIGVAIISYYNHHNMPVNWYLSK